MTPFFSLPIIIKAPGRYKTRGGEIVTVDRIVRGSYGAHGHYENGTPERWDVNGRTLPFSESNNDIVGKDE
jgi:hypothetical protein